MTAAARKDQRLEFRTSRADRELFERAAEAVGVSISTFAHDELRTAARRVLADRREFRLSPLEASALEDVMARPPRDVEGLRALLDRPSPFVD